MLSAVASVVSAPSAIWADGFAQTNLVTDDQSVNAAKITDPNLINPWGVSYSPSSPFWVSDNGTGVSTLYKVGAANDATNTVGLVVSIPGAGNLTGQVFNGLSGFNSDLFLFVSEDGTISGWRGALGTFAEVLKSSDAANVYKGAAFSTVGGHSYLYSANFRTGNIDVMGGDGGAPSLVGNFTDPSMPAGFAPFNVQNLNGTIYVTYALQDGTKSDEVAGAGLGFVDAFDLQGSFLGRVGSQGTLNAPWGLAIAPTTFGDIAGDLLVGNFGDGRINVFDPVTHAFIRQLTRPDGNPLSIEGLWALTPGNGGSGGSPDRIYFTAGPGDESHGLLGSLTAVPEPSTLCLIGMGVAALIRRRSNKS